MAELTDDNFNNILKYVNVNNKFKDYYDWHNKKIMLVWNQAFRKIKKAKTH